MIMVLPQVCRRRVKVGHDAKEGNSERFGEATMPRAVTIYNIGDGDDKDARQSGLSGGMTGGAYSSDAKVRIYYLWLNRGDARGYNMDDRNDWLGNGSGQ